MIGHPSPPLRALVFDLDGTLYVSEPFLATIHDAAIQYIQRLRRISFEDSRTLVDDTRTSRSMAGTAQTLSAICCELGGTVQGLHDMFNELLEPERFLVPDYRVTTLLERLSQQYQLYIYTNNNRLLADRIIDHLGLEEIFRYVFTIDETWVGKPEETALDRVLTHIGFSPPEVMFIGDRYEVDLATPEQRGCPVYLSKDITQLLRLEQLIHTPEQICHTDLSNPRSYPHE